MHVVAAVFATALAAGLAAGLSDPRAIGAAVALALVAAKLAWRDLDVELGPEGVTLQWLGGGTILPYASIASVMGGPFLPQSDGTVRATVCFVLHDGREILVDTGECRPTSQLTWQTRGPFVNTERWLATPEERAEAERSVGTAEWLRVEIVRAVSEHVRAFEGRGPLPAGGAFTEGGPGPSPVEQWLSRRGRSVDQWLGDLGRSSKPSAESYRKAPPDDESLWRVLEDSSAEPSARAGAAVLLRARSGPGDAERARVAVEQCAPPRLRAALGRVLAAEGDAEAEEAGRRKALAQLE